MTCSVVGASGRQATLGTPSGFQCRGGLHPLPTSGNRFVGRHRSLKSRSIVRALPDGETSRAAMEALGNLGGSHPVLAGLIDHPALMLYSIADGSAPVVGAVQSTAAAGADAAVNAAAAAADTAASVAASAADTAAAVAPDAAEAAASKAGWFGFLADAFETTLQVINGGLEALHVPYSYGFAIILLTVGVKALTFPLSKKQVESSIAMQQLQPRVKEIQEKFKNNPERLQQETAALYQEAGVNPLAGCLPTLATIPIFIGLYRSLTQAADEGLLKEGWFFIPSLGGPTTLGTDGSGGISWLFPFENGAPPVGWHDAGAYLILPILLVISQVVSQKIISPPKSDDPSQQQMQSFLNVLPFMLGWFSLNVPSGLTLYWITNNILSTGQQAYLKSSTKAPELKPMGTVVKPKEDPIERVTGAEMGSRRSRTVDVDAVDITTPPPPPPSQKGAKFRARKAKEAAKKAAQAALQSAPPELAAEITPLTENLGKEFAEGEEQEKNGNGAPAQTWAVKEPAGATPMVATASSRGKKKKGKKGKKGKKAR